MNESKFPIEQLNYYPSLEDPQLYKKIFDKAEFYLTPNIMRQSQPLLYQIQPHQMFVKNFLSPNTPYNGLLLFYGTGSGKTCAALQIAEQMRPYVTEAGGRIIVLGRSGPHVEDIFKREMYDVQKELNEINNYLPPGTSHCLGQTYSSGIATRLVDEYSFGVNLKRQRKNVGDIYEFYGYTKFTSLVTELEKKNQFLEDYFANCIFIVDEAHNFAGMEVSERAAVEQAEAPRVKEDADELTPTLESELVFDSEKVYKAERLRIQIINSKRALTLNRLKQQDILSEYQITEDPTLVTSIAKLQNVNIQLTQQYGGLKDELMELYRSIVIDMRISERDKDIFLAGLNQQVLDFSVLNSMQLSEEARRIFAGDRIFAFLSKIDGTTGLKNEYPSFLKDLDKLGNIVSKNKVEGLKTYQALKRVLVSLGGSKVILLTATPMRDRPDSIRYLLNTLRINDGKNELSTEELFNGSQPNREAIAAAAVGYVSRYRGDTANFPKVIWNLQLNPNAEDRALATLPGIEMIDLHLNPLVDNSPSLQLVGCRSKPNDPQDQDYWRYLQYQNFSRRGSIEGAVNKFDGESRTQLEFRCNFAFPLERDMMGAEADAYTYMPETNSDGETINYLVKYNAGVAFKQLFNYDDKGYLLSNFSYRQEELTGRFLDPDQVGQYSAKIKTLLNILNNVSTINGKSGGINLIYSKFALIGCYLIALALEETGYRRYPGKSLWADPPKKRLCSICNKLSEDHNSSTHNFKQAYYVLGVKSSEEVSKYLSVLRADNNRYGEEIKVIIGTQTITEGLDFKFIRYIHVFEPWYNFTRLDQIAGRGSRQGSHLGFPKGLYKWDNVTMFLYCYLHSKTRFSDCPKDLNFSSSVEYRLPLNDKTDDIIDETDNLIGGVGQETRICSRYDYPKGCNFTRDLINYLTTLEKDCNIKLVEKILNEVAIDCPLYLATNDNNSLGSPDGQGARDFSRECFYSKCSISCPYLPPTIKLSLRSGRMVVEYLGRKEILDERTTLETLGLGKNNVVGARSGNYYLPEISFLDQLKYYNDWRQLQESDENLVAWIIDDKDYSTFYLSFFATISEQLVPVLKYMLIKDYGLENPIIALKDLVKKVKRILSFNIRIDLLEELVAHAMGLMSGVYRQKQYAVENFIIIPLRLDYHNNLDTFYILHPDYIEYMDSSTYYKYIWPQTIERSLRPIEITKWIPVETSLPAASGPLMIMEKATSIGISPETAALFNEFMTLLNDNPWNRYEIYSKFGENPDFKLLELMYQLINNYQNDPRYRRLINYLAHYLEFKSLSRIEICKCGDLKHVGLQTGIPNVELQFLFENKLHRSEVMRVTLTTNGELSFVPTNAIIPTYEDPFTAYGVRNSSPIAIGNYGLLPKSSVPTFKLHNKLVKGTKYRDCKTFTFPESQESPGLVYIYANLAARAKALPTFPNYDNRMPSEAPRLWTVWSQGTNTWVAQFETIQLSYSSQSTFKSFICYEINLLLRFLHDFDPQYQYFEYKEVVPKSKGTNSATKGSTKGSTKGRKKKVVV